MRLPARSAPRARADDLRVRASVAVRTIRAEDHGHRPAIPSDAVRRDRCIVGLVMSVLAKTKCKVGGHSGEWSLLDGRCTSFRTCDSCGKLEARALHAWGAFDYVAPGRCDQR